MPELPEVETVRRTLHHQVVGLTVTKVEVLYAKIVSPLTRKAFESALTGQTLHDIQRLGKYLIFVFDDVFLLVHLRMEGKFFIKPPSEPILKHEHVVFTLSNNMSLRYDDVRKFGTMNLRDSNSLYDCLPLSKLGYEPDDPRLTPEYLKRCLQTTRVIKTALLDQTIILGLGNIYVDEVLFCAKINPSTRASTLSRAACETLIHCAQNIIAQAVTLGGTSIRTYLNSLGISGKFQNELSVHLKRAEPCPHCQTPIQKIKVGGRGTYYCPNCQKL